MRKSTLKSLIGSALVALLLLGGHVTLSAQVDRFAEYVDRVQWVEANRLAREEMEKSPQSFRGRERYLLVVQRAGGAHPDPQPERRRVILETIALFPQENLKPFIDAALKDIEPEVTRRLDNDDLRSAMIGMMLVGAVRDQTDKRAEGVKAAYSLFLSPTNDFETLDPLLIKFALMEYLRGLQTGKWEYGDEVSTALEENLFRVAISPWNKNPRTVEVGFWPEFARFLRSRLILTFEKRGTRISHAERAAMLRYLLVLTAIMPEGTIDLGSGADIVPPLADPIPQFDLPMLRRSPTIVRRAIALTTNSKAIGDTGLLLSLHELLLEVNAATDEEWATQCTLVDYCLEKNAAVFHPVSIAGFPAHLENLTYCWGVVSFLQAECTMTTERLGIDSAIANVQVFNAVERRNAMQFSVCLQTINNEPQRDLIVESAMTLAELAERHLDDRWAGAVKDLAKIATNRAQAGAPVARLGEFQGVSTLTIAARDAAANSLAAARASVAANRKPAAGN
ncbi:hypothetical protein GC173_13035 [bacterium]|nr:hypothetical protein [bacterium]